MSQKQSFFFVKKEHRIWWFFIFVFILISAGISSYINSTIADWWKDMVDEYIASNGANIISWILQNPFNLISTLSIIGLAILAKDVLIQKRKNLLAEEERRANEAILVEPKISIQPEKDDLRIQKDYIFKQIVFRSQIPQKLLSCYATIHDMYFIPKQEHDTSIKLIANELVWAKSNSEITDNKTNLVEGNPKNLYIARINPKKKTAELVGVNNYYTPISKGTYYVTIKFDGENFTPRIFSMTIFYDGEKSIEFKNISGLSMSLPVYPNFGVGSIGVDAHPNTSRKNNFLLSIIEFLEKIK